MPHASTPIHPGFTATLLLALAAAPAFGQEAGGDPAQVASDQYAVVFENDAVRVLETNYAPGATSHQHAHPDHVAIMLTEGTWRLIPAEGEPVEFSSVRGEPMWVEAGAHAIENLSETRASAILVELKRDADEPVMEGMADEAGAAEEAEAGLAEAADPVTVAGDQYSVLLDNEDVRVLKVSYAPGAESAMHGHPGLVAIALTDATWIGTTPDGETYEELTTAGEAGWNDAGEHVMRNASETAAEVILVEIKGH